jgi:hypothetical protein
MHRGIQAVVGRGSCTTPRLTGEAILEQPVVFATSKSVLQLRLETLRSIGDRPTLAEQPKT